MDIFIFFFFWYRQLLDQGKEQEDYQVGYVNFSEGCSGFYENRVFDRVILVNVDRFYLKIVNVLKFRIKVLEFGVNYRMVNDYQFFIVEEIYGWVGVGNLGVGIGFVIG